MTTDIYRVYLEKAGKRHAAGWGVSSSQTGIEYGGGMSRYPTCEQAQVLADRLNGEHATAAPAVAPEAARTPERAKPYTTVDGGPLYGLGRRYASQPGATQYDGGDGRFTTQIWDNS